MSTTGMNTEVTRSWLYMYAINLHFWIIWSVYYIQKYCLKCIRHRWTEQKLIITMFYE